MASGKSLELKKIKVSKRKWENPGKLSVSREDWKNYRDYVGWDKAPKKK